MTGPAALPAPAAGIPFDLERLAQWVLSGISSANSRRAYANAFEDFCRWYASAPRPPLSKLAVEDYRVWLEQRSLAPSTINIRLTVIRRLAAAAAADGFLAPETAAAIGRVQGARTLGRRTGNWLSKQDASRLLRAPDPRTLKGKRDRVILGLLIGCGLRRSELAALDIEAIAQREARWVIVDLRGKGNRLRTVPIPAWTKHLIDDWLGAAALHSGRLLRPVDKKDRLAGGSITPKVIWWVVMAYARQAGIPNLAPHDLRRTCAKLCRAAGGEIEQIQLLLGHASIQTTEQYLGTRQNLADAVNDHLGLEL